ncbi:MAG: UbiD family decarboxylase [Azospirillaceae bacterium]
MPSLTSFLETLPEDEILRIEEPTPLDHVTTALVLELERRKRSPVVRVERPEGFDWPVVANLFGDRGRIARMVGDPPGGFHAAWARASRSTLKPRLVDEGSVHEVIEEGPAVDAGRLPICRHFEQDAGRYIGSGILICKNPDTGIRNLSFQRMMLKGPDRFGASLHSRGDIWDHLARSRALGRNLEVAVVIGAHPAIYLAAAAKVPQDVDELDIACGLLDQPVDLVACRTIDVEVPAEAEIVLEGEILADVEEDEGPYGEYTGYSTSRSTRNVFVVKAITRRRSPVFLDVIPGYSSEHLLLGRSAKEANVAARLKDGVPGLKALNYPKSGTHFHAYLSFEKTAEGQARHALMLLFGLDPYLKFAVAVDSDIDVFDEQDVLWALATRFQADTDMFVVPKVFGNRLDPSSPDGTAAKLGLDATRPLDWDVERTSMPADALARARAILTTRQGT